MVGCGVFDGLDVIVDGDGDGARGTGKISANHEDNTEFAESVSEGQDDGGNYARQRKRKNDLAEGAPGICAEDAGRGKELWVEAPERGDEGLDAKWKAVENAGDDESGESERELVTEEGEPEFAERAARSHGDEEIKAENGGWENERESDDGFDEKFGAKFGEREPVGERSREEQKNRGDQEGEAEREEEFGHGRVRLPWNWMTERFGFGKTIFFEDGLRGR